MRGNVIFMEKLSFTFQEILSQPEVWQKTIQRLYQSHMGSSIKFDEYDQILFTGCGSTYYLSLWASRWCEMRQGVLSRAVLHQICCYSPLRGYIRTSAPF